MNRKTVLINFLSVLLLSLGLAAAVPDGVARVAALWQRPKPSPEQETRMFGAILAAVTDFHGGYLGEARSRYERIVRDLEKYDYSTKLRWQAYDGYGLSLLAVGDKNSAVKALLRALEEAKTLTSKEQTQSTINLAFAYAESGKFAEAIQVYQSALTREPGDTGLLLELGSVYRRAKQFSEAREIYEKMIARDPRQADVYGNLGNVYLDQGEIETAVAQYEKFAALSNKKDMAAKNFLNAGFRYYDQHEYQKALALYQRALEITPGNPLVYIDIGWATLALGRSEEAVKAFEKALALNPPKQLKDYAQKGLKEARARK